jgi:hypothetical protein
MSRHRFEAILQALACHKDPPPAGVKDPFCWIRGLQKAWSDGVENNFDPGWSNVGDESVSPWTQERTCPGFMVITRKPHKFGNKHHSICCTTSCILWRLELMEGKARPRDPEKPAHELLGKAVGLMLRMCEPTFGSGRVVTWNSGFCVLKGIVELKKRGVCASALVKKPRHWPKRVPGVGFFTVATEATSTAFWYKFYRNI